MKNKTPHPRGRSGANSSIDSYSLMSDTTIRSRVHLTDLFSPSSDDHQRSLPRQLPAGVRSAQR